MVEERQSVSPAAAEDLPTQLCGFLAEQVAWARDGNMVQVERVSAQVDAVVAAMTQSRTNQPLLAEPQQRRLERLYDALILALRAEQADVQTGLRQLRQVRRALGAYSGRRRGR